MKHMVNGQCMREHRVRLVASQRRYVRQIQPTTHRRWGIFARPSPPSRKLLGSTVRTHSKERRERLKSDHPAFSERRPKPPSGRLTHSPKPVLPNPSRPAWHWPKRLHQRRHALDPRTTAAGVCFGRQSSDHPGVCTVKIQMDVVQFASWLAWVSASWCVCCRH